MSNKTFMGVIHLPVDINNDWDGNVLLQWGDVIL